MKKREKNTKKNVAIMVTVVITCLCLIGFYVALKELVRPSNDVLLRTLYLMGWPVVSCSGFSVIALTALKLFD